MIFTSPTPALSAALKFASRAADARSTMPILAHLALRVSGDTLTVTGTDLNRVAIVTLPVTKAKDGLLVLPAKKLTEAIAGASAKEVTIAAEKTHARIKAGRVEYQILGVDGRDLPKFPAVTGKPSPIVGEVLAAMIDRVDDAVCTDETRFHLNGVYLEIDGAAWRMVTTDGHRMAVSEREVPPLDTRPIIVPLAAIRDLKALVSDAGGDAVDLAVEGAWLKASHGDRALFAKLIDAQFPPWRQVVPKHSLHVEVSRAGLLDAVKRCALMTSDVRGITLAVDEDELTLTAEHPDAGSVREVVECSGGKAGLRIGFAPKYALQALGSYTTELVRLEFGAALDPLLIRPVGADASFSVVMPMRL
jgi:DNA polymerase-3 subunit beta